MGGLVVAKAITIADSRRDRFPVMFEAIAAAIFFGTPFNGAPVASAACMYAFLAEKVGMATSSKLLDLMKPGDEGLRELKHEFMRLVGKINPRSSYCVSTKSRRPISPPWAIYQASSV